MAFAAAGARAAARYAWQCTCAGATGLKGWNQPYRALEAGMPADKSGVNRRDLAAQGIGLLLHRRLLALCRQHGRHRTTRLDIMSTNAAALALIGKLPEYNEIASPHTDRRVFECRW